MPERGPTYRGRVNQPCYANYDMCHLVLVPAHYLFSFPIVLSEPLVHRMLALAFRTH